jgi:hypothetical protein
MAQILLIIVVVLMVPKIIRGFKEGLRFAGRILGWAIAFILLFFIIKTLYL